MDTCTISDCTTVKYAKGLCRLHYRRTQPRTPDQRETVTCDTCAHQFERAKRKTPRWVGTYCSYLCRDFARWGAGTCELPADHMARHFGATCKWEPPAEKQHTFQCGTCSECGASIVEPAEQTPSAWCSTQCAHRVHRRRRRAREHQAPGDFTFTEVMRIYLKQGKVCAYCEQPVVGLPDPEHVLPLSRGGRNDTTNLVAACRACNTDKNDLTLTEWAADRERRGLPPVRTDLPRATYSHLVHAEPTTTAWRHRQVA